MMTFRPVNRNAKAHLVMRKGFLRSHPASAMLTEMTDASTSFTTTLAKALQAANQRISRRWGALPFNDTFWDWIDSVPDSSMAQGVPFKKTFFSLGLPVHPNVMRHARYLKTFFETTVRRAVSTRRTRNHSGAVAPPRPASAR